MKAVHASHPEYVAAMRPLLTSLPREIPVCASPFYRLSVKTSESVSVQKSLKHCTSFLKHMISFSLASLHPPRYLW